MGSKWNSCAGAGSSTSVTAGTMFMLRVAGILRLNACVTRTKLMRSCALDKNVIISVDLSEKLKK